MWEDDNDMNAIIAVLYLFCTVVVLGMIGGWIANIFKLVGLLFSQGEITIILVGRVLGVLVPFLGAILGFF